MNECLFIIIPKINFLESGPITQIKLCMDYSSYILDPWNNKIYNVIYESVIIEFLPQVFSYCLFTINLCFLNYLFDLMQERQFNFRYIRNLLTRYQINIDLCESLLKLSYRLFEIPLIDFLFLVIVILEDGDEAILDIVAC